jgi:hypothetical protein
MCSDPVIQRIHVSAYKIPTDFPESDGTLEWSDTSIVIVEAHAGGKCEIGAGILLVDSSCHGFEF